MTITQTALLELTDQWKAKVATLNAEASEIRKKTERETAPHTPDELAENVYGFAAGYAAARNDLLRYLEVCMQCVGMGSIAHPSATTKQRLACWKCKGTGMAICPTNAALSRPEPL